MDRNNRHDGCEKQNGQDGSDPGIISTLRWLYIDLNSYFASVEQQLQPKLRGRPVIVIPVQTDSTSAIAASYEAKAFGVKTGTPVYEAKKKCPGLICVLAHHERYVEYHHRVFQEVERHIPVTAVCSIDEFACRLMNNEVSPSRATQIALSIKAGLAKNVGEYVKCSIGLAPNRYLAKVATDFMKPDGLTIFQKSDFQKLFSLSLRDLPGIGFHMERRLKAAGIHTMSQLLGLSAGHMRALWRGVWGERLWYLLRGWEIEEEESHRSTVGHSHVLAPELRSPAQAFSVVKRLMLKAASRLRRLGYQAQALTLSIRYEDGRSVDLESRCLPTHDSFTFLTVIEKEWKKISFTKSCRLRKVGITLHRLRPLQEIERELFDTDLVPQREKRERVSHTMDAINQHFGRDSILLGVTSENNFSGTKIAFNRIPDQKEFFE